MYWAKLVCPNVTWKLLVSTYHTTIISSDGTQMFDLLAYAWKYDRFTAYCCGTEYIETDLSLGADEAMKMVHREKLQQN